MIINDKITPLLITMRLYCSSTLNWELVMSIMNVKETAKFIGVSVVTLRRYIKADKIPYLKVGGLYKFNTDDIIEWMRAGR